MGSAIAVPVIEAPIRDGQVQIALASNASISLARLAAILQAGPLPLPRGGRHALRAPRFSP